MFDLNVDAVDSGTISGESAYTSQYMSTDKPILSKDVGVGDSGQYVVFEREVREFHSCPLNIILLTRVTAHSKITNILRITHYYHRMSLLSSNVTK